MLLTALVIGYGGSRARYLITGDRPNISSFTIQDARNETEVVDLIGHQCKFAFGVETIKERGVNVPANDPNYVEWTAYLYDTEQPNTVLRVHQCTSEDFA